jgi:hypothetical protein
MNTSLDRLICCTLGRIWDRGRGQRGESPDRKAGGRTVPLEDATMIIEYNASAEDIGIQFFLDSEGWREIEIFDPSGREVFSAETGGSLTRQGGGTELFLESVEPPTADLPINRFLRRFPEGTYRFRGLDNAGNRLVGEAEFSHDIPVGPQILLPRPARGAECAENVPARAAVVAWNPVRESIDGEQIEVVRYEVIIENEDDGLNFDVKLPATVGTRLSVPVQLLRRAPRTSVRCWQSKRAATRRFRSSVSPRQIDAVRWLRCRRRP